MRIAVESWAPEYGSPLESGETQEPDTPTDLGVELPVNQWRPIQPSPDTPRPSAIHFVDGVQRIDARVWITPDDGRTQLGICASYAAGIVRCGSWAEVIDTQVRRTVITTVEVPALTTRVGRFEPYTDVAEDSIDELRHGLQRQLADLENEVADRNESGDALVVLDGPVSRGRYRIPGTLGYVKSHHISYLPASLSDVVSRLRPGERTPIFLMQTAWSRYSWYLKLPGGEGHPWSGVVRCEASAEGEVRKFSRMADQTAAVLPDYASERHKEPRAPQNLYPISVLERELRRRLGDAYYISREMKRSARLYPDGSPDATSGQ